MVDGGRPGLLRGRSASRDGIQVKRSPGTPFADLPLTWFAVFDRRAPVAESSQSIEGREMEGVAIGAGVHILLRSLGSRASRRPSPMKFTDRTVREIKTPGQITRAGANCRKSLAS